MSKKDPREIICVDRGTFLCFCADQDDCYHAGGPCMECRSTDNMYLAIQRNKVLEEQATKHAAAVRHYEDCIHRLKAENRNLESEVSRVNEHYKRLRENFDVLVEKGEVK